MRLLLAELAPRRGDVTANLDRVRTAVAAATVDLAIFPELFLTGYRVGDRIGQLALRDGDATLAALRAIARESRATILVGAPTVSAERPGELHNAAVAVRPDGEVHTQVKRYLPNFGPFEEGVHFSPTETSEPLPIAAHSVGVEICYDVFFPEVARTLAVDGAELLVNISASPVTSAALFQRLLPARAIENALPVVYANRVGVEDGFVFAGGSGAWDARGEPLAAARVSAPGLADDESLLRLDIDLAEAAHWRPFRPVLRDITTRPTTAARSA